MPNSATSCARKKPFPARSDRPATLAKECCPKLSGDAADCLGPGSGTLRPSPGSCACIKLQAIVHNCLRFATRQPVESSMVSGERSPRCHPGLPGFKRWGRPARVAAAPDRPAGRAKRTVRSVLPAWGWSVSRPRPRCRSGGLHRGERSALRCRAPPCSRGVRVKKGAVPPVGVCAARGPAGRCADRRSAFQAVPALFRNRRYAVSRPSGPRCRSEDRRSLPNSVAEAGLATPGGAPAPTSNPLKRERLRPFPGGPYTRCPHSGGTEILVHREVTDA